MKEGLDLELQDPEFAAVYLTESYNDSTEAFLVALGDVIRVRDGGIKRFAEESHRARLGMTRALSGHGNPGFAYVRDVLTKLDLKIAITR
ncbi:MAG: transcriptional regulator [Clostridia bacterium]|nr:transcriptional regulator [Deltaproteobacteria bacterium]